jgi:hypothetical protein
VSTNTQVPLQEYARPITTTSIGTTDATLLSYRDWLKTKQNIIPGQEYKQYNAYLLDEYKKQKVKKIEKKERVKLNYLALIRQLQLFFSKKEADSWYNQIDINNEQELLLAIPYFARKLKEISQYYLQLREDIKQNHIRYRQIGTNNSIVKHIQKIIFENIEKTNQAIKIPYTAWTNNAYLSGDSKNILIQIEELYDKQNYLDRSPTLPASAYYNINDKNIFNFLTNKNIQLTSTDWLYKLGTFSYPPTSIGLDAEIDDTLENVLPDETLEEVESIAESTIELLNEIAAKYIAENKLTVLQAPISSIQTDIFTIFLNTGENSFLWPGTPYNSKAKYLPRYRPTSIQNLQITNLATGGTDLSTADKIFVKAGNKIEGAWLASLPTIYTPTTLKAIFNANTKTAFKFPFPGFGLSAEGYTWTGPSLSTTPQFFYLEDSVKQAIEADYWNNTFSLTSLSAINIHDTTLIYNKAYPNLNYNLADKIIVRDISPPYEATNFNLSGNEAWLYRMNHTDISISANSNNVIYWPFEKIDTAENYPQYFPNNPYDVCTPQQISAVYFPFAIVGDSLSSADVIFKITNYLGTSADAIECCWLSGNYTHFAANSAYATSQNSLQGIYNPGTIVKFLWLGKNNTDIDIVFKSLLHQADCDYITKSLDFRAPEGCTCKQTHFTPFGHPGENYTDYNSLADFVVESKDRVEQLDLTTIPLSSFCWFKTNTQQGWGDGKWVTVRPQSNNKFYFETGKVYAYYRATPQNNSVLFPPLITKYDFNSYTSNYNSKHIWVRAYKDLNGNWISTNKPSKMILTPGDLLLYSRNNTTSYILSSLIPLSSYISENRGSIWSNVDYLTINDNSLQAFNQSFTLNWPTQNNLATESVNQYPLIGIDNILNIEWRVRHLETNRLFIYKTPAVTIVPTLTGRYQVTAVATTGVTIDTVRTLNINTPGLVANVPYTSQVVQSGIYTFTNIPLITAVSPLTFVVSPTSYPVTAPGFVLKTPLRGWDYNINAPESILSFQNIGGKPFWAKTNATYKQFNFTGVVPRLVDSYNIIYQPKMSDIMFNYGQYIEYTRNYPADLNWLQPVTLKIQTDFKQWCILNINLTSSNLDNQFSDLIIVPTLSTSNLLLQNYVNNEPVEIIYQAQEPFIWQISAIPEKSEIQFTTLSGALNIDARTPWLNLTNLQYPTVAVFPTFDQLYTSKDSGGYFTPYNLGASKFINRDYTIVTTSSSTNQLTYFEDPNKTIRARGFTKQDPITIYNTIDNNIWLKEPVTTGPAAGTINKKIFKKYQKFIPYQSKYETTPQTNIGLLLPQSRQTPWGGKDNKEWTDLNNFPKSPTGELNVKRWADTQILKQTLLQLDNWVTDIFGNQYGLYKNLSDVKSKDRKNIYGTLWIRNNNQNVLPAVAGLNKVFDTYIGTNLYNELTDFGIRKIDMFFDTLFIQTSSALIFEKIKYDYEKNLIFSTINDARYISLAYPITTNLNRELNSTDFTDYTFGVFGDTWFLPDRKKVLINANYLDFTPSPIYKSTFSWEFYKPTTSVFTLNGEIPLPSRSDAYIVNVGGVIQPHTTYTITPSSRELKFNNNLPPNFTVNILLLYNPNFIEEYDYLPLQYITSSPVLTSQFSLNDLPNLTTNSGQYIVTINGVLQRPKNLANITQNIENSYILSVSPPYIQFTEPVQPNHIITITRLPQHKKCIASLPFYTWVYQFTEPTKQIEIDTGPGLISDTSAYIVNVGGVLQTNSSYSINTQTKTFVFLEPIPPNTYISITQMSVPQYSLPRPYLYELDLTTQNFKPLFPVTSEHFNSLNELLRLRLTEIGTASLSYNSLKDEILLTVAGKNCAEENIILEIVLSYQNSVQIKTFTVFESIPRVQAASNLPFITNPLYTSLTTNISTTNELNYQLTVANGPVTFTPINLPNWISLLDNGTFFGSVPKETNIYNAEFCIENVTGKVYYNLTIDVNLQIIDNINNPSADSN